MLNQWLNYSGKYPTCNEIRQKHFLLSQIRQVDGKNEYRYLDLGCGKPYLCVDCGEFYTRKKTRKMMELMNGIKRKYPNTHIMHAVFTIPHEHELAKGEEREKYPSIFHAVQKTIENIWPKSAAILALHNWSSAEPEKKHLHIHCLIICLTDEGECFHAFRDSYRVRQVFRDEIQSKEIPVVHMSYHSIKSSGEIYHLCRYLVRSPILDFCRDHFDTLTTAYIERVSLLFGVHRFRYIGWLSNSRRAKSLQSLQIEIIPFPKDEPWVTVGVIQISHRADNGDYITVNGYAIKSSEVVNLLDTLPPFFSQCINHAPP